MMRFRSFYKTKSKAPIQPAFPFPPPPRPAEVPRPVGLPRTGSIKINTKGSGTPRPSISTPAAEPPSAKIITPASRQPSFTQTKPRVDTPPATAKRPVPNGAENSAAKRPRTETPQPLEANGRRKSSIVTVKVADKKRLSIVLGVESPSTSTPTPKRTSLPGIVKKEKEPTPEGIPDALKPVRKPLPTGDAVRRPLPGASSMSPPPPPPPPRMTINTNAAASPAPSSQAGRSATPGTPASGRPKIKLIRKPKPDSGASGSPPAP